MAAAGMVVLRSEDGVELVVTEPEARHCGTTVYLMLRYDFENHVIPSGDGDGRGETRCRLVRLRNVQGDALSKVVHYAKMHASSSGSRDLTDWDAEFIAGFDNNTLFDLILASEYLQLRGLIELACQAIASKIKGKSPREICGIFNIKSPELSDEETVTERLQRSTIRDMDEETPCSTQERFELEEKALKALHIVRCQEFTGYDPKANAYTRSRIDLFNIALFDLDKESGFVRGPPLFMAPSPMRRRDVVDASINVISLRVLESDVGFPIKVFGTVVARDQVDYRCVSLFRRERDDPQLIPLKDGKLTLTDPCRGLVPADRVYFEIDLKILHDGGEVEDFSKGVIIFNKVRLPDDKHTMAMCMNSYLSRVEVRCAYVAHPIEATISVHILKGPICVTKVAAWTTANFEYSMALYGGRESEATEGTQVFDNDSVPLSRRVVAVPLGKKLVLHITGRDVGNEFVRSLFFPIHRTTELIYKILGNARVEVKVMWTVVPRRERQDMIKLVGDEELLM